MDADSDNSLGKINRHSYYVKTRSLSNHLLLPHQQHALEALDDWFDPSNLAENKSALVSMPIGSGKTGVMACLPYFIGCFGLYYNPDTNVVSGHPDYPFNKPGVLVIAPNLEIARQLKQQLSVSTHADGENEPFLIQRDIVPQILPTIKILTISDFEPWVGDDVLQNYDMIIAVAQGQWKESLPINMFRLVIVNEAQHYPATTWRHIQDHIQDHALVVFFTGVPCPCDGKQVVGKTTHPVVYHLSLKEAVGAGIIRKAEFIELEAEPAVEEIMREVKKLLELKNGANRLINPNSVAHMAMAIAKDKAQADSLLDLWKTMYPNDAAETYHSEKPKLEKDQIMTRLKNNELRLVIVVKLLLVGFDYPPISIAAITCNIGSPVKFEHFVGRALRVYRGPGSIGENNTAHIVTHKDYKQRGNFDSFQNENFIPETAE